MHVMRLHSLGAACYIQLYLHLHLLLTNIDLGMYHKTGIIGLLYGSGPYNKYVIINHNLP